MKWKSDRKNEAKLKRVNEWMNEPLFIHISGHRSSQAISSSAKMPIPFASPVWLDLIFDPACTRRHTHTCKTHSSRIPAAQQCQMEKSGWLVEVSAFLGVGPSEHTHLVTPPDMEMEEAWPSAVAAYWTINFHFNMTLEDIEVASVSSLGKKRKLLISVSLTVSPFLSFPCA